LDIITTTFFLPVFSHYLIQKYGFTEEQTSIFFIINMISYFLVVNYLREARNIFGVKLTITIGLLINSIAVLMMFPISILPQYVIFKLTFKTN